ncbi:hypothetical protein U9M48_029409 [Paspalum notatum var. saurae]|uniref:Uncharacterized protein n=1 Tax=Paspalum notatum var. saurae TaxID=547442 RepID=A0AAQ3X1I5_PASNO
MASVTALTILLGFFAAFCNLDLLDQATAPHTPHGGGVLAGVATSAFAPAVLVTFGLTILLLVAHLRALAGANAGGDDGAGGPFLVRRLTKATVLAAVAALLASSVLRLAAGGYLGGADDVG